MNDIDKAVANLEMAEKAASALAKHMNEPELAVEVRIGGNPLDRMILILRVSPDHELSSIVPDIFGGLRVILERHSPTNSPFFIAAHA